MEGSEVPANHETHPSERDGNIDRTRVVIAVDLPEELCAQIEQAEPRAEVIRDHTLYRPRRNTADWSGDPDHQRTPAQQQAYEAMIDSAEVLFSLPDADTAKFARTVHANPRLRWVQAIAAGSGAQLRDAQLTPEELRRVAMTTAAGVHGSPLAEFAVFGVLAGAKDLPRLQRTKSNRVWDGRWEMAQLDEMSVLVVGLGGIGTVCAQKFSALGARVLGTTRSGEHVDHVDELVPIEDLPTAAQRVDAIVVTLPATAATDGLLDADLLSSLRPGTIIVNVGRGTVIDEPALIDALDAGTVGFAALDVFAEEPLPASSPLWEHPNVVISAHTAALSNKEEQRIVRLFIDNLERYLDGRPQRNVVDTVEFY